MTDRTGKNALITGGSNGIGRAVARRFSETGIRVAVTGRSAGSLDATREDLPDDALVIESDAGSRADIGALRDLIGKEFDGLDVLVLNAGIGWPVPLADVTDSYLENIMAVNYKGPLVAAQAFADLLRPGGAIVVTSSIGNRMARPAMQVYDASKAAVRSLVRALAADLIDRGIRVNAVQPGATRTAMLGRVGLPPETRAQAEKQLIADVPMGRMAEPAEVAAAVEFLAFDATFTTGAELPVDGGQSQI